MLSAATAVQSRAALRLIVVGRGSAEVFFFAPLPYAVADVLWFVLGFAAIVGALRLLGIRDWRCYGALLAWPAVWSSLVNGAISALLVFGCAALWRYRDRAYVAGTIVAALVVFK